MQQAVEAEKDATKLLDASGDFEEDTGNHEFNINIPPAVVLPPATIAKVESLRPGVVRIALTVVQKFPPMGAVFVALAIIAGYVYLRAIGAIKWP